MLVAFPKQESSQSASMSWLPQWNNTEKRDLGMMLWSLCIFSEPSILFHLTFILEIRDEGYDSYLWHILEHCLIPGITRPESRRTAKGSTSPTAPKQFFLEYTAASTQPVRRAWKGRDQRETSMQAQHPLTVSSTQPQAQTDAAVSPSAEVGTQTTSSPCHTMEQISSV